MPVPLPFPDPEVRLLPVQPHHHQCVLRESSFLFCFLTMETSLSKSIRLITTETLDLLLRGNFVHLFDRTIIVDARFPFEHEGGHIVGAINRFTRINLIQTFLTHVAPMPQLPAGPRVAIVFHCEFSSHRAPMQYEFLRMVDEEIMQNQGVKLFPEVCSWNLWVCLGAGLIFLWRNSVDVCARGRLQAVF
jgi:hypothetical protein